MEVSGQPHAPAALPPGKRRRYPLNRRLAGPQGRSGGCEEQKSRGAVRIRTPRQSSPYSGQYNYNVITASFPSTGACFRVAVYNEQPEQDSLNDPNSGPEPASTPAELNPPGKHRHHSRPKLRSGRALLGIFASGRSSAVDMLEHTEPL